MFGLLIALTLIRRLQLRAFRSIQLSAVLTDIDLRGREVLDALYPLSPPARPGAVDLTAMDSHHVRWPGRPAVIRELDLAARVAMARRADAVVVMNLGVGDTLQEGAVLATVRQQHQRVTRPLATAGRPRHRGGPARHRTQLRS